ncbi:hypothetical protein JTE90_022607 [Oedothorax gibbosus]|uniref:Uncharacterized protein n=1 Tax=Oedothorax gibbosus TaxID=931172 RepID=A0AAV6TU18_9ARAC|nr:hypothetical protein JTE90_022607 [Oedothorax gibbosus]
MGLLRTAFSNIENGFEITLNLIPMLGNPPRRAISFQSTRSALSLATVRKASGGGSKRHVAFVPNKIVQNQSINEHLDILIPSQQFPMKGISLGRVKIHTSFSP